MPIVYLFGTLRAFIRSSTFFHYCGDIFVLGYGSYSCHDASSDLYIYIIRSGTQYSYNSTLRI